MTTKDEALKMAIDYLEYQYEIGAWGQDLDGLIGCCKEALEQQEKYVLICKRCGDDLGIKYVP